MSLEWPARPAFPFKSPSTSSARSASGFLTWSNPLAWWWGMLTLVSALNIALWFALYRELPAAPISGSASGTGLMLVLCGGYVFGCAFRSVLPRADVQRICLFDTWLSSVMVGRSVATVAELCFAAQWAIVLYRLGITTGADTALTAAWVILPLILIAECCSWHAVLTTNYLGNAIENSIWAVAFFIAGIALCRMLPEFDGPARVVLAIGVAGIVAYLAFLMTVDVPMYFNRWRTGGTGGNRHLSAREGLRDVSTRWVVTHDLAEWREEIVWMSLYFSMAVWASLALCVCYSLGYQLPRYRTEASVAVYANSTASAPLTASALSITVRSSEGV